MTGSRRRISTWLMAHVAAAATELVEIEPDDIAAVADALIGPAEQVMVSGRSEVGTRDPIPQQSAAAAWKTSEWRKATSPAFRRRSRRRSPSPPGCRAPR